MNYGWVQWEDMCYRGTLSLWVTGTGRLSILTLRKQPCLVAQDSWLPCRAKFIPSHPRINNASSQRMKNNCHHQGQQIFPLQLCHDVSTDLSLSLSLFLLFLPFFFSLDNILCRKHASHLSLHSGPLPFCNLFKCSDLWITLHIFM